MRPWYTITLAALLISTNAHAQSQVDEDIPPFEEIIGIAPPLEHCPTDLQRLVPGCTLSATFTGGGKVKFCICDGVREVDRIPFPPNERNITRLSEMAITKIVPDKSVTGGDPCEIYFISGKKKQVCWDE